MSKRTSYYRRTSHEIKGDTRKGYSNLIKYPGKINPVFLQKPYSACEPILRSCMDEGKESINEGAKCREKAHGECQEGKG